MMSRATRRAFLLASSSVDHGELTAFYADGTPIAETKDQLISTLLYLCHHSRQKCRWFDTSGHQDDKSSSVETYSNQQTMMMMMMILHP
jgi:hypothetical protein